MGFKPLALTPLHDTTHMVGRSNVPTPVEYGNDTSFWVEYPTGLVDLSRTNHLSSSTIDHPSPPPLKPSQAEIKVDGNQTVRINKETTAAVIIDMQNFFLHPDLSAHPLGLKCVEPLMNMVPVLRSMGIKILWVNWGLTDPELKTIPPALVRGFKKDNDKRLRLGSELGGNFGRSLMRGAFNSELYGPLQDEYLKGQKAGSDFWINKNRISGLWGYQTPLDLFLQENGITTLLFSGVNTDQCVSGTLVDAYFRGYDCIVVEDTTATTSPKGGFENVIQNTRNIYGFVTDSKRVIAAAK